MLVMSYHSAQVLSGDATVQSPYKGSGYKGISLIRVGVGVLNGLRRHKFAPPIRVRLRATFVPL
jgi:hypothetical protein